MKIIGIKRIPETIKIFIYFILNLGIIFAQWEELSCPEGGLVYCFAQTDKYIYAGTFGGGIFKSSDKGESWCKTNNGLIDKQITVISLVAGKIFAGTYDSGVFVSEDEGENWVHLNKGLPLSGLKINSIVSNGKYLFIGSEEYGLFVSENLGKKWEPINNLSNLGITALHIEGNRLYAATNTDGVYFSDDDGKLWIKFKDDSSLKNQRILSLKYYYGKLWAATQNGLYYLSNFSWVKVFEQTVFDLYCKDKSIYLLTNQQGVMVSRDQGATFQSFSEGLIQENIFGILQSPLDTRAICEIEDTFLIGTYDGIYKSNINRCNWVRKNKGIGNSIILSFFEKDKNIYAGTWNNGIYMLECNSQIWENKDKRKLTDLLITSLHCKDKSIFMGSYYYPGIIIKDSNDNINHLGITESETFYCNCFADYNDKIMVGTNKGLFILSNTETTWDIKHSTLKNTVITSIVVDHDTIYVSCSEGLMKSTNRGESWTYFIDGLSTSKIYSIVKFKNDLFISTSSGVFRFNNKFIKWEKWNKNLENQVVKQFTNSGDILFAANNNEIFYLKNKDEGWTKLTEYSSYNKIWNFMATNDYLYLSVDNNVYRYLLQQLLPTEEQIPFLLNNEFVLLPNYPNPFNPSTKIVFLLPEAGYVTINLYNSLGQVVKNICANEYHSMGRNEKEINMTDNSSGVYYYQINFNGKVKSGKINFVR